MAGCTRVHDEEPPPLTSGERSHEDIFIPKPSPSQADLLALAQASVKLKAVMPLDEDEVDALGKDFKVERKTKPVSGQRKRR